MTLAAYIVALALNFICSTFTECENIRHVVYLYRDCAATLSDAPEHDYDYQIVEQITYAADEGFDVVENVYDIPLFDDGSSWHDAVRLIAKARGVDIREFYDNTASGYITQERLDAYKDIYKDGFVNDLDSFDYLDEREIQEQKLRYIYLYVSFGIFYMSAKQINSSFRIFRGRGC